MTRVIKKYENKFIELVNDNNCKPISLQNT